jgi:hypothetical protein
MKFLICSLVLFCSSAIFAQTTTFHLPSSSNTCADSYANAMFNTFALAEKHHRLYNQAFIFGALAQIMYAGDHSQDSILCSSENLEKIKDINGAVKFSKETKKAEKALMYIK